MKLPIKLPFGNKEPEMDYYLVLLLRDEKVTAVILEEKDKTISVKNLHEEYLATPLEQVGIDTLTQVLDKTISKAEEVLPTDVQTQKTIFGVKDSWVEEKRIKKEFLDSLKEVGNTLGLKPIGFLVISEAIAHQIQTEEGAPLSGLVAEISKYAVTITLFKGGKLVETHSGPIEESITKTVDTLLKHFTDVEVLPSRLLLLNADHTGDIEQQFISHQWSKSLPFLHMPQISLLSENFDAIAAVYGGASQMGFTVTNTIFTKQATDIIPLTLAVKDTDKKDDEPVDPDLIGVDETLEDDLKKDDDKKEEEEKKPEETKEEKKQTKKDDDTEKTDLEEKPVTPSDNFGFVLEKDITTVSPSPTPVQPVIASDNFSPFTPEKEETPAFQTGLQEDNQPRSRRGNTFAGVGALLSQFKLPTITLPPFLQGISGRMGGRNKKLLIIPVALVLFLIIIPVAYSFMEKATVTLFVKQKSFSDDATITFAVDGSNDFASNTLAAKTITVSIDGTVSADTTGKKDLGDKAKGTVTLYNSGENPRTLSAGAVITSSTNVDFTLDKDVTISSASGDIFTGTKPGTAQIAVTAKTLGPEGNLPSNTKFSVPGSTTIAGKNDNAFSGGSKKSVTVVSKSDRDKLLLQLPKELEEKAKEEITKQIGGDEILLPFDLDATVDKKEFDKSVDEETKKVTLNGSVTFAGIVYKTDDIKQFALEKVKEKTSTEISLADDRLTQELTDIEKDSDTEVTAKIAMKAGLLPKLDNAKLADSIKGKSAQDALIFLRTLPQTEKVEITFSPAVPFLSGSLPKKVSNIEFVINSYE